MSNYLVVGLGRFGRSVAKTLYKNGKTVLALEQNEELVQQAIEYQIVDEAIILDVTDEKSLKKIFGEKFLGAPQLRVFGPQATTSQTTR